MPTYAAITNNTHAEIVFKVFGFPLSHVATLSAAIPYIISVIKSNTTYVDIKIINWKK